MLAREKAYVDKIIPKPYKILVKDPDDNIIIELKITDQELVKKLITKLINKAIT
jgi:hypothetical protein